MYFHSAMSDTIGCLQVVRIYSSMKEIKLFFFFGRASGQVKKNPVI